MYAWQFAKMLHVAGQNGWTRFVSMQDHYNLLYREEEREMLPLCRDEGIASFPGVRSRVDGSRAIGRCHERSGTDEFGKHLYPEHDRPIADKVAEIAAKRGIARAQVALAWLHSKSVVTRDHRGDEAPQLEDALASVEVELTADEIERLEMLMSHT